VTESIEEWLRGGPGLVRVQEINEMSRSRDGVPVLWVSFEVWDDRFCVTYVTTLVERGGESLDAGEVFASWDVADDAGTVYAFSGGGGGGDGTRMRQTYAWAPRPPQGATLRVANPLLGVEVEFQI
jgi:hypothetical protein